MQYNNNNTTISSSATYSEKLPTTTEHPILNEKHLASPPSSPSSSTSLEELPTTTALPNGKELKFHQASFPWRSVNITSSTTGQPLYYAEISAATPKKPDVNLRSPDRNGASVARSHFRLSRSMRAGVGSDDLDLEWTEFTSSPLISKGSYDFVFAGKTYRLQRTHSTAHVVGSGLQKANLNHFKFVDVESGSLVAVYVSKTYHPARMIGTLTLKHGLERELEVLIVLGVVGWREKMRRRAVYYGSNGGGGGG